MYMHIYIYINICSTFIVLVLDLRLKAVLELLVVGFPVQVGLAYQLATYIQI